MKIPPNKPHFFKPILPGFKNGLKIPIGFLKYLKGHEYIEHAVLKRAGKKWLVKLNGQKLEEGNWGKFTEDFDLQVGNILVFRHEGNMEFEVSIFDSTHCSREYPQDMHEEEDEYEVEGEEEDEYEVEGEEEDEYEVEGEDEDEYEVQEEEEDEYEVEEEDDDEYKVEEEDKDEVEKEERMSTRCKKRRARMSTRWKKRMRTRYVAEEEDEEEVEEEEDDEYEVEEEEEDEDEVEEEERMSMRWKKWRRTRTRTRYVAEEEDEEEEEEEEEEDEDATHDKHSGQSHFECTIGQYCLTGGVFFLPQQFALANGLTNKKCKLIVRDERQRSWKLKLCSSQNPRPRAYIVKGWRKFIAANCIKEGDRIMFEVVSNGNTPVWKFQVVIDGEIPLKKFQEKPSPNIDLPNKTSSHAEAATNKPFVRSHFECTIRQKFFSRGLLYLPPHFAIANGLTNKRCWLIVRDERQRSWNLKLSSSCTQARARTYVAGGWHKFITENCLKEGDRIMFEVITNGETPIWKFQVVTDGEIPMKKFQEKPSPSIKLSNKTSSHAEAATNKRFVQSHFECTLREYCFSRGLLYLPKRFAFANGLIDKKYDLVIRDERQRSWNLKLNPGNFQAFIGDGWRKFIADKCLKEGDRIKFEIVTNGETPIWKFHFVREAETPLQKFQDIMKKSSNMSSLDAQVSTSTSGDDDDDHPYFVSTIKPYCISKTEFLFPLDFAKSNGLMNRKCEMILKDETERCWSVGLGRLGNRWGITSGWTKFRAANGIQVGDAYKFELIKNGEIPIAQFHCKYSAKVAKRKKH